MFYPSAQISGSIHYALGTPSLVSIPIPGMNGLCIDLSPRGYVLKGGSTLPLFLQDAFRKRHPRLDYGYNIQTKTIDYHWNQTGTHANFGINDHTSVGRSGAAMYKAAKYFRYAGRVLVVVGAAVDIASIVESSTPLRRASEVVSGWTLAWAGCKIVGAGGAAVGTLASPIGTAVGGICGCIIGGYGGYQAGTVVGGTVYDWANTVFRALPQVSDPTAP
jgi:hypothetical protein